MNQKVDSNFEIRPATPADADEIADLSAELGYPASQEQILNLLEHLKSRADHVVFVMEVPHGPIVGWIHAYLRYLLISGLSAEIGGIVIRTSYRRRGLGKKLLQHVEEWAGRHGCETVALYSGMHRDTAHLFYPNIGYTRIKSSWKYEKKIRVE
jgi:GNAT superfamily N-acetyltransferase